MKIMKISLDKQKVTCYNTCIIKKCSFTTEYRLKGLSVQVQIKYLQPYFIYERIIKMNIQDMKTALTGLISEGQIEVVKTTLATLKFKVEDIEKFIKDIQDEILTAKLASQREAYLKAFIPKMIDVDGNSKEFNELTENGSKLPFMSINLVKQVNKDKETGVETVIYSWNISTGFKGVSTKTSNNGGSENPDGQGKSKKVPCPNKDFTGWQAWLTKVQPELITSETGFNARRAILKQVKNGSSLYQPYVTQENWREFLAESDNGDI